MKNDLLQMVRSLTRNRGLKPLEYRQTLEEANHKRRGASSILRKDGIGIDVVFQEFDATWPGMFNSLDDFVEALAERLYRKKSIDEKHGFEECAEYEKNEDFILLKLQTDPKLDYLGKEILGEKGLIEAKKGKRKVQLTEKAIKKILELSLEE